MENEEDVITDFVEEGDSDDVDWAPDELLLEERNLKERREGKVAKENKDPGAPLSDDKFKTLDLLLEKTNMYSQFLSEQIQSIAEETEKESKIRSKSANDIDQVRKRAKVEGDDTRGSPTRELVPLLTGGELRPYQLKGITWLISLYQNGLNGILADQMGLGKTVQCIGFLCHLREKMVNGPFLVLGPLSTLPNWVNEFKRWTNNTFPCILYHGSKEERSNIRKRELYVPKKEVGVNSEFPVVVTSYEIIIADIKHFQKYNFKYIIVDEGHRLKNFDCKLIRELRTLKTANKLLLTGTPLQNSLPELWSLMNFVMPEVFPSLGEFESWFDFSNIVGGDEADGRLLEEQRRNKVVSKLHGILQPFVLRRVKTDVETSLPKKKEIVLYAQMTSRQQYLSDLITSSKLSDDENLQNELKKEFGYFTGKINTNNLLMQLRKIANHPDLLTGQHDGSVLFPSPDESRDLCGKMKLLDRLIERLKKDGHKVLIFSQMTKMLDLLESHLTQQHYTPCRIDGSVSWELRQQQIDDFNTDPDLFIFLLSTRAGGLGINLTAADTAIIYDSDWNPHQDLQAMDRCHRIGQTRPVHVYRLATSHSVEGRLLKRASEKLVLDRVVMAKGAFIDGLQNGKNSALKEDDLKELLKQDITQDGIAQSKDISEKDLNAIMDRSDIDNKPLPEGFKAVASVGPGWEIVEAKDSANLLSGVNNN